MNLITRFVLGLSALAIIFASLGILLYVHPPAAPAAAAPSTAIAIVPEPTATTFSVVPQATSTSSSSEATATASPVVIMPHVSHANSAAPTAKTATADQEEAAAATPSTPTPSSSVVTQVDRMQAPYSTAPESLDAANTQARAAIVNILCTTSGGTLHPISGSGVLIDPRGVILTNAHVAQYVLLSEDPDLGLNCTVRTGSPAQATWKAAVLYIPKVWVAAHASDINTVDPTGTGEHDYALLFVIGSTNSTALPSSFPSLPFDTREAIGFPGDQVLVASYPAEFLGGIAAENDLYAATSQTTIGQLLTFSSGSVDLMSLGGIIEAQSGSSGGAVVNPWGYLIGLIVTTTAGATTGDRDLHALTLSYVNSDLATQTGTSLSTFLSGDLNAKLNDFYNNATRPLLQQYLNVLTVTQR